VIAMHVADKNILEFSALEFVTPHLNLCSFPAINKYVVIEHDQML
jgi:hypothetical protein